MADEAGERGGYAEPTRDWDETNPTNATTGDQIDDEFRNLRVDLMQVLDAQHWFSEEDEATKAFRWRGAHRRSMVTVMDFVADTDDLETWTDTHFGTTTAERKRWGGALIFVGNPGTSGYIYGMRHTTGAWVKVAKLA